MEQTTRKDHPGLRAVPAPRTSGERCPRCSQEIPADAPMGLCPSCLFGVGIDAHASDSKQALARALADTEVASGSRPFIPERGDRIIAGHRLDWLIASGGQGEVHHARDMRMGRNVALKILLGGERPSRMAVRLFQAEVKAFAKLDHPHIVPIYEAGEHDGQSYYTMKLMKGGSLAKEENRKRYSDDATGAAHLVEKVARAVHHLHQAGILHRDLKLANILLDEAGEPYVADFGVAKHLDESRTFTHTGALVGTVPYMSPEQTDGHTTAQSDVYSLGVILYELITGRRPFQADNVAEIVTKIKNIPPQDPRAIKPSLDRDLALICLQCLEKDPEHRYGSAEALAQALRQYLDGGVFEWAGRAERAWRWCLRHSMTAGLITAVVTFLLIMMPSAISLARGQEAVKRAQITQVNMNSAAMVAGTVLSQLRALSDAVERVASQKELAEALEKGDDAALQAFCMSADRFYEQPPHGLTLNESSPFDLWAVFDEKGVARALSADPITRGGTVGRDYSWRNYFKSAWHLAGKGLASTYVSPAFKGEADGTYKFNISVPLFGSKRQPIGILAAAVPTAANLGSLVVRDTQSIAVLVAPRDRERDPPEPASTHLILLHPDYTYGEAIPIDNEQVQQLDRASRDASLRIERPLGLPPPNLVTSSDDYKDPVAIKYPQYAGRWLAGFAPVGNTGFVVIVQTREDEMLRPEIDLGRQLAKWVGISATPGVLLVLFAAWHRARKTAKRT